MGSNPIGAMTLAAFVGLAASLSLERFLEPKVQLPWSRSMSANCLHGGTWLTLFLIEFLQFWRPWLACVLANALWLAMILISNVKYNALREPFVYQDIDYFVDLLRHPRLYLPFFGYGKAAWLVMAAVATIVAGVYAEPPLSIVNGGLQTWITLLAIALGALVLLWFGVHGKSEPTLNPLVDLRMMGLIAMLWNYRKAEGKAVALSADKSHLTADASCARLASISQMPSGPQGPSQAPHVVVVQSESFFDIRRAYSIVRPHVLEEYDAICGDSLARGTLEVPARGANTVRTEFSFMTGIPNNALGIDQFNPYRRLATSETISIARLFKERGYRTICIHPYPGSFYRRSRAIPALGFDQFLDISEFSVSSRGPYDSAGETSGSYISDDVVARKVIQTLQQGSPEPLFIFVITMENHGPLHLEMPTTQEQHRWLTQPPPGDCGDLIVYLRHLNNADNMIKSLRYALASNERPGLLAWYGDHIPIMKGVYRRLGEPAGSTDYFLWRSDSCGVESGYGHSGATTVEQLGSLILNALDMRPAPH